MALLREVIAKFAVQVDGKELNKLDRQIDYLKDKFEKIGRVAAATFAAGAFGAYKFVEAASSADEALNVLQRTFGQQSNEILKWSKVAGGEMSRSMYEMQDAVGRFGAFLQPQFKDTTTDIGAMSMALTRLSVDLASFYNTSDQEAAMRLFSGLSGETEAVRRLGIDISDTALDDFNKKHGDATTSKKRMAALSLTEKTLLRYSKIMKDTVDKQNDAILTADSWANRLKQVKGRLHEVAVEQGRKLIPVFKDLLKHVDKGITLFERFANKTTAFRDFMVMAAAAYAAVNAQALLTNAAIFATLGFIQDIVAFTNDQDSFFGDFLTEITGLEHPLRAVKDALQDIIRLMHNFMAVTQAAGDYLGSVGGNLAKMPGNLITKLTPDWLEPYVDQAIRSPFDKRDPSQSSLFGSEEFDRRDWDQTMLDNGYMSLAEFRSREEKSRQARQRTAVAQNDEAAYVKARGENTKWEDSQLEFAKKRPEYLVTNPTAVTPEDIKKGYTFGLPSQMSPAPRESNPWSDFPTGPTQSLDVGPLALPPSVPMSYVSPAAALMSGAEGDMIINQNIKVAVQNASGTMIDQINEGIKKGQTGTIERYGSTIRAITAARKAKRQ